MGIGNKEIRSSLISSYPYSLFLIPYFPIPYLLKTKLPAICYLCNNKLFFYIINCSIAPIYIGEESPGNIESHTS